MSTPSHYPFFVYGTLLPDQPNHYLLADVVQQVRPATFENGRLYDLGFYPMLIEGEGAHVRGALVSVAADAYALARERLDQLEGFDPAQPDASVYRRVLRRVLLADGQTVMAWVYVGCREAVNGRLPIPSNHWPTHINNKQNEIQAWWTALHTTASGNLPPHLASR